MSYAAIRSSIDCFLILAINETVVNRKVAVGHATSICVNLLEHRDVQVEPAIVALVHHPGHRARPCRPVRHLLKKPLFLGYVASVRQEEADRSALNNRETEKSACIRTWRQRPHEGSPWSPAGPQNAVQP